MAGSLDSLRHLTLVFQRSTRQTAWEYLSLLDGIRHEGYYVRMAVAWALSFCFVKFPEQTMAFLHHCHLDDFTFRKTIQKIGESYRVSEDMKKAVKALKR